MKELVTESLGADVLFREWQDFLLAMRPWLGTSVPLHIEKIGDEGDWIVEDAGVEWGGLGAELARIEAIQRVEKTWLEVHVTCPAAFLKLCNDDDLHVESTDEGLLDAVRSHFRARGIRVHE